MTRSLSIVSSNIRYDEPDDDLHAWENRRDFLASRLLEFFDVEYGFEVIEDPLIMTLVQERQDIGGDRLADAIDGDKFLIGVVFGILRRRHRRTPGLYGEIGPRQQPRCRLSHLAAVSVHGNRRAPGG